MAREDGMDAQRLFESFATTVNNRDPHLGKTGDRCFHIGIVGGCGLRCAAFCDGECEEPYEFSSDDLKREFNKDELAEILEYYPDFGISLNTPHIPVNWIKQGELWNSLKS
jgi:hypothetical protein